MNSAVLSRCTKIEYNFQSQEIKEQEVNYVRLAKKVCVEQNIQHDGPGLSELYKLKFPDFRALLVILQQFLDSKQFVNVQNVTLLTDSGVSDEFLYKILEIHDAQKFYEAMTVYKGNERDALISLGEPFFKYLNSKGMYEQTIKASIIVAKYSNQFVTTINRFGTFFGCMSELRLLLR
jgi:hypothetical protein